MHLYENNIHISLTYVTHMIYPLPYHCHHQLGEKRSRDMDIDDDEDFGPKPTVQPKDYAEDKQVLIVLEFRFDVY